MKLVSDFDGVLTNPVEEVERVRELFYDALPQASRPYIENIESEMLANPSQNGWWSEGRLAAYCDEDGFIRMNALGFLLDRLKVEDSRLANAGIDSFSDLARVSFRKMTLETMAGKYSPLDPMVPELFRSLWKKGFEIVIVSNSSTERIEAILKQADLKENPSKLRIRGHAGKFQLGQSRSGFKAGDYFLETDRPAYEAILLEEKPDILVGDVVSLDLSVPLSLSQQKKLNTRVVLRQRSYTPQWSLSYFQTFPSEVHHGVINALDELHP